MRAETKHELLGAVGACWIMVLFVALGLCIEALLLR